MSPFPRGATQNEAGPSRPSQVPPRAQWVLSGYPGSSLGLPGPLPEASSLRSLAISSSVMVVMSRQKSAFLPCSSSMYTWRREVQGASMAKGGPGSLGASRVGGRVVPGCLPAGPPCRLR